MNDSNIVKKYRTKFLGSVYILIYENNTIILENRTFRCRENLSRILLQSIKNEKSSKEQYEILLKAINTNCQELDKISFLIWQQMR
jgi:hypothetical protein